MKTTINIADALLEKAKRKAAREKRTLKSVIEEGLQRVLSSEKSAKPFRLKKASFKGEGLQPEMRDASWEDIRDSIYRGRSG